MIRGVSTLASRTGASNSAQPDNPPHGNLPDLSFSTKSFPARERFDRWREQHRTLDITPRSVEEALHFEAERVVAPAEGGIFLSRTRYTANKVNFGKNGQDLVLVSLTTAGEIAIERKGCVQTVRSQDGLVLIDGTAATRTMVVTNTHEHIFLGIPRSIVATGLSRLEERQSPVISLDKTPLGPFITAQLRMVATALKDLPHHLASMVAAQTADMVMAALDDLNRDAGAELNAAERALLNDARVAITYAIADPDFTAGGLAARLGCSRAHLYSVFGRTGDTVANALRTARMSHARRLLVRTRLSVGAIATAVGYRNEAAFSRAFRASEGVNPIALRNSRRADD